MEILAPALKSLFDVSDIYLYASFTLLEYSLLTLFLYRSIRNPRLNYVFIIGSVAFLAVVFNTFLHGKTHTDNFDSLSASAEAILIIIYSILFLYGQIKDPSVLFVYNTKKFWVVAAVFIYFSATLFLFLYAGTFTKQEHKSFWYINNIFDLVKNILFCIAFAMKKSDSNKNPIGENYEDSYLMEA